MLAGKVNGTRKTSDLGSVRKAGTGTRSLCAYKRTQKNLRHWLAQWCEWPEGQKFLVKELKNKKHLEIIGGTHSQKKKQENKTK